MKKLAVISLSGGMDSTSLLLNLLKNNYEVYALSFNYGQRHNIELERLQNNIDYLKEQNYKVEYNTIDVSILGKLYNSSLTGQSEIPEGHYNDENMKSTVVPNRNAIFSSMIFGYALSLSTKNNNCGVDISMGVHNGDFSTYPDCRPEFHEELLKVFKLGNWDAENVNYYLPYINIFKKNILEDAIDSCKILKLEFDTIFKNTNTCYNPNKQGESCGKCGSCTERLESFQELNIIDPVTYSK